MPPFKYPQNARDWHWPFGTDVSIPGLTAGLSPAQAAKLVITLPPGDHLSACLAPGAGVSGSRNDVREEIERLGYTVADDDMSVSDAAAEGPDAGSPEDP